MDIALREVAARLRVPRTLELLKRRWMPCMITRRQTLLLASGIGLYSSGVAGQQVPGKVPRIGVISTTASTYPGYAAFGEALRQLGYVEGQNIHIEQRFEANLIGYRASQRSWLDSRSISSLSSAP